jgi:hypothetical protein
MADWSAVKLVLAILEGFTQIAGLDAPHVLARHSSIFWRRAGVAFAGTPRHIMTGRISTGHPVGSVRADLVGSERGRRHPHHRA